MEKPVVKVDLQGPDGNACMADASGGFMTIILTGIITLIKQAIRMLTMTDLYEAWSKSLSQAGIQLLSDDTCCRLLAILYVFGGDSEAYTFNRKLRIDLEYAQKRMNIGGALIPDAEMASKFRAYAEELEPQRIICKPNKPEWAVELMKKYGIKL